MIDTEQSGEKTEEEGKSASELLKLVDETFDSYKHGRAPFERQWYRNILFLMGNQWILWDTLENKWRKKRLASFVPTPVTNKFASAGQRLVSVLARIEPNWEYVPATSNPDDIKASDQCELAEQIICEENHIESIRQRVSPWVVYTGNCYLLSGVEPVMGSIPSVTPEMMPEEFSTMPPEMQESMLKMAQSQIQPQIQDYKLYTDVLTPFEVYLDQTVEDFSNQNKVLIVNRRSKEYVKNTWGEDIDTDDEVRLNYQETIGYITSDPYVTSYLAGVHKVKRVTVKRLFVMPDDDYPEGLYAVKAGGKILESGPLPKTKEGKPFIPISEIKFDNVPGAAFGRTPMDDIVQKQVQRNKVESLIELIAMRMSSPIWLMPEGTVVQNFSGAPGAIVKYSLVGDKATRPDRIPGEQIPSSIVQFLSIIDKDIEDLVSTFEALKGQSPYSGAPGVVIEQLIEQGLTRFGPSLRNIAEGYRQWMIHQLEFFRSYGIVDKTIARSGTGQKWDIQSFKGADILGAVNVRVESDSTVPRSSQVEVAKVIEAINAHLVDISDPTVRLKVLQKLKIADLMDDVNNDILAAIRENELIASTPPQMSPAVDVTPFIDNHAIHIKKHKEFVQSDSGQAFKQIMMQHITKHNMIMDAEQTGGGMPAQGKPGQQIANPVNQATKVSPKGEQVLNPGSKGLQGQLPPSVV